MGNVESQLDPEDVEDYVTLSYLTHRQIYRLFERFKEVDRQAVERDKDARLPIDSLLKASKTFPELQCNPFKDRLLRTFSSEEDDCLSFEDFIDLVSVFSEDADEKLKSTYAFQIFDFDGDGYIGLDDINEVLKRLTSRTAPSLDTPESAENEAFSDGTEATDSIATHHERDGSTRSALQPSSEMRRTSSDRRSHRSTTTVDIAQKSKRKARLVSEEAIQNIARLVMEEADLGKHGAISLPEFIHLTSKLPDFTSSFTIRF